MTRPTPESPPTGMVAGDSNRRLKWVKVRVSGEPAYQIRACSIPLAPQMTAAALAPCI